MLRLTKRSKCSEQMKKMQADGKLQGMGGAEGQADAVNKMMSEISAHAEKMGTN